jgi:hypothetical protein
VINTSLYASSTDDHHNLYKTFNSIESLKLDSAKGNEYAYSFFIDYFGADGSILSTLEVGSKNGKEYLIAYRDGIPYLLANDGFMLTHRDNEIYFHDGGELTVQLALKKESGRFSLQIEYDEINIKKKNKSIVDIVGYIKNSYNSNGSTVKTLPSKKTDVTIFEINDGTRKIAFSLRKNGFPIETMQVSSLNDSPVLKMHSFQTGSETHVKSALTADLADLTSETLERGVDRLIRLNREQLSYFSINQPPDRDSNTSEIVKHTINALSSGNNGDTINGGNFPKGLPEELSTHAKANNVNLSKIKKIHSSIYNIYASKIHGQPILPIDVDGLEMKRCAKLFESWVRFEGDTSYDDFLTNLFVIIKENSNQHIRIAAVNILTDFSLSPPIRDNELQDYLSELPDNTASLAMRAHYGSKKETAPLLNMKGSSFIEIDELLKNEVSVAVSRFVWLPLR